LNLVSPDLRDIAVLTEPLTIAQKALSQIFWMMQRCPPWLDPQTPAEEWGVRLSALVLGIGPVGLLGAMAMVSAGFTTYVYSHEILPSPRIDLVTSIGATYVSTQALTFADLAEQMDNIDVVYEAIGHSHFALEALGVLGTNGILVLTGVPGMQAFVENGPGSAHAGHGAEESGPARHSECWAGRLRIRLTKPGSFPAQLAPHGANPDRRSLSP
jgi:threonine dehydrogenase-like Zn-dependent dehydrogenase